MDSPQHTTLDNFEDLDQGKGEKEPQLNHKEWHLVTSCEERFNFREGVHVAALRNVEKLEIFSVLWQDDSRWERQGRSGCIWTSSMI